MQTLAGRKTFQLLSSEVSPEISGGREENLLSLNFFPKVIQNVNLFKVVHQFHLEEVAAYIFSNLETTFGHLHMKDICGHLELICGHLELICGHLELI